jgi:hypothetical protein
MFRLPVGNSEVITVLLAVVAMVGFLFSEIHLISARMDSGFETMNRRFDQIDPPTVSFQPAISIAPQIR